MTLLLPHLVEVGTQNCNLIEKLLVFLVLTMHPLCLNQQFVLQILLQGLYLGAEVLGVGVVYVKSEVIAVLCHLLSEVGYFTVVAK